MENGVATHFHKQDKISEKDLIPNDEILSDLPVSAQEGARCVVVSGSTYTFYQYVSGAWRAVGSGAHTHAATDIGAGTVDDTEFGYLNGVTSAIQTQLNAKAATSHNHSASDITTGTLEVPRGGTGVGTLAIHGVVVGNGADAVSVTGTGTSGQVLTSNGASADPTFQDNIAVSVNKLAIFHSSVTVGNSSSDTDFFSVTVPGGTLGTDNGLRIRMYFNSFRQATASGHTITIRLKYNGTILTLAGITPGSTFQEGNCDFYILAAGATNAQQIVAHWQTFVGAATTTTSLATIAFNASTTSAVDSTADKTLAVSAQWSGIDANSTITMTAAIVEKLQ